MSCLSVSIICEPYEMTIIAANLRVVMKMQFQGIIGALGNEF